MTKVVWEEGLTMFGVPIGVERTKHDDIGFQLATNRVVEIANKLTQILLGATLADAKDDIKVATDGFQVLKEDFERGAKNGVFNPKDVEKMVEVVNEFIENPLALLEEETEVLH